MGCVHSTAFDDDKLYVIVSIFNPCGFNKRIKLYNEFADLLKLFPNVVLFTIECVFGDQKFSVTHPLNPNHKQIRTSADNISWVKENLINICVCSLPKSSKYFAWLDADIEYPTTSRWVYETIQKFKQGYKVLQLFSEVELLGPSMEVLETNKSFCYCIANDNWTSYGHPGMAWAMTKEAFIELGGLYDLNPVGSSDLHFAHALIGNVKQTIKHTLSDGYKRSVLSWADRLANIVGRTKDKYMRTVGYVNVKIRHHYHGNKDDRQYVRRWDILERHNFDPYVFYIPADIKGGYVERSLRKINPKISQSFRYDLIDYFRNRKEDNIDVQHTLQSVSDPRIVYNRPKPMEDRVICPDPLPIRPYTPMTQLKPISKSNKQPCSERNAKIKADKKAAKKAAIKASKNKNILPISYSQQSSDGTRSVSNQTRSVPNQTRSVPNQTRYVSNQTRSVSNQTRYVSNQTKSVPNTGIHRIQPWNAPLDTFHVTMYGVSGNFQDQSNIYSNCHNLSSDHHISSPHHHHHEECDTGGYSSHHHEECDTGGYSSHHPSY